MMIRFTKAHACGNDFLIVDEADAKGDHARIARYLCERNTGVGADGVEFLERKAGGKLFLRLFNADGSEAELSGNGTRCVAAWLAYSERIQQVVLGTHGGPRSCRVLQQDDDEFLIATEMGVPVVTPHSVDVEGVGVVQGADVNVGNPHFVIFTEDAEFRSYGLGWQELGAKICVHPAFPHGTNVEFVRVISPVEIAFRIYERGVGPTTSSGTGTCASAAASIALRGCGHELEATSLGGAQQVVWQGGDAVMHLTGPARVICVGEAGVAGAAKL